MTPKEKAIELVDKMYHSSLTIQPEESKQCAIIVVDEILSVLGGVWADVVSTTARSCSDTLNHQNYWQEVKDEINNIIP